MLVQTTLTYLVQLFTLAYKVQQVQLTVHLYTDSNLKVRVSAKGYFYTPFLLAINTLYRYFMDTIEIKTLIDVTNTNVVRPNQGTQLQYDQNRNFITLRQCVELRSIVRYDNPPTSETVNIKDMGFGTDYKGEHTVWTFVFSPDRVGVYADELGDEIGHLFGDLDGIPIIKNLTETINIDKAIFDCRDLASRNTIIKAHKGTI